MVRLGRFADGVSEPRQTGAGSHRSFTEGLNNHYPKSQLGRCHACGSKILSVTAHVCRACLERGHDACPKPDCKRCQSGAFI
jgi:hypothetical protein